MQEAAIESAANTCDGEMASSAPMKVKRRQTTMKLGKWSGRGDSNARPQPWQGCALPLSYARSCAGGSKAPRGVALSYKTRRGMQAGFFDPTFIFDCGPHVVRLPAQQFACVFLELPF
jgi:hypothetical protein